MRLVDALSDGYAQRALLETLVVGVLCGVVGVQVVLRRLAFFTMAMTHATFPGIVLAAVVGIDLYLGSALFGLVLVAGTVLAVGAPGAGGGGPGRGGRDVGSVTGVVLSGGFALGVAMMSARPGFTKDLTSYLVGSVLTVSGRDLATSAATAVAVLAALGLVAKELTFGAFDPVGLAAAGYPARAVDFLLLLGLELTIVTSVPAVGTVLSVALIVAPAATARLWCDRLGPMTALAAGLGALSGVVGLAVSLQWDVAAGGAIVLTATAVFVVSLLLRAPAPRRGAAPPAGVPVHD